MRFIVDEDGYEMMVTGATEKDMEAFMAWLDTTTYYACTGYTHFKIPKNGVNVNVYIISSDTRWARGDIRDYWIEKGCTYDQDNVNNLKCSC